MRARSCNSGPSWAPRKHRDAQPILPRSHPHRHPRSPPSGGIQGRLLCCPKCGVTTLLCAACDRGNVYCSATCAKAVRTLRNREAGARYRRKEAAKVARKLRVEAWRGRRDAARGDETQQGSPKARNGTCSSATGPAIQPVSEPRHVHPPGHPRCCCRCGAIVVYVKSSPT